MGTIVPIQHRLPTTHSLHTVWSLGWYGNPIWRKVIEAWKYVGDDAAKVLVATWLRHVPAFEDVTFTWVPLHPKKERTRGFDQARWMAEVLSECSGCPMMSVLERVVHKGPRARSDSNERDSLEGVYRIREGVRCPRCVVLCDDVRTTGETLEVCAKWLKKAGAEEVIGCVLVESTRVA